MAAGHIVPWTSPGGEPCCCEEEPSCCMYPATGLGDTYTEDDLPDAVTVNGVSKSRSGSQFGNTTDGIIWESGIWARYTRGIRATQACLITGDGNLTLGNDSVEDQFAASYNVSIAGGPIVRVNRVSLCAWQSDYYCPDSYGAIGIPEYTPYAHLSYISLNSKWYVTIGDTRNCIDFDVDGRPGPEYVCSCSIFTSSPVEKAGSQSTPVGDYTLDVSVALL